ncbi:hypothetical protein LTR84_007231 [Exophiala bonariae]|uniref:Saccharopine dehydrogenase NADP binding domain-containing protein n=1 Tax=Exophiala bonariae TaxID=1690606 RepID=A0AAV9MZG5_9EURO|nr:hypothetical protein LTR84_007231 [Exophiala bonariae]
MVYKQHGREYDIVVFGATGYSGTLTAEHIASKFPPELKWAIAGRSADKLQQLATRCKELAPTHISPAIEVCQLDDKDVSALARRTFAMIAAVGPYALYGEHAFKACAESGTYYVDCTPEVPWTLEMIKKYEATAKTTGACMFPQCAMESAPSDLLTWAVVTDVRSKLSSHTGDVVVDMHELQSMPSGGTVTTFLNLFDTYSLKFIGQALKPYALSPVPNEHMAPKGSFLSAITGQRTITGLGRLSTSATGPLNTAIVHRTWGLTKQEDSLNAEFYGPNFTYQEYMNTDSFFKGVLVHYSLIIGALFVLLPPFRALVRKAVFQPGEGPDKEKAKNEIIEFRAVAMPDTKSEGGKQVFGQLRFPGSMYYLTAALLGQAVRTLLEVDSGRLSGGIYTPACLGREYVDRLEQVGLSIKTEVQNIQDP